MNQLADALSPYLRQHAANPVDWREWSPVAFAEAAERDVPVLLSVGYAACHWCHVMAHESFEDPAVARVMNAGFVNVKVDREERPDVDSVYMAAVVATTGRGGWPMTVFLTPGGEPFLAGTYFPPEPVAGMPAFRQVLHAVSDAWANRRADLVAQGEALTAHLRQTARTDTGGRVPSPGELDAAVRALAHEYDAAQGGFGAAPKFPPSMTLVQLLRHHARTGSADALELARGTCEAMARGGIYDQLGGGFSRYSVDGAWVVPHFEKMLYDNAQLLGVYAQLWRATGAGWARRVALETAGFLLHELRVDGGAFASSLDADTDGVEGRYYVWHPEELSEVLGPRDGAWAAELLAVTAQGTFEEGASTLQLRSEPEDAERWRRVRAELLAARGRRTPPARDDKVVAGWNGMAIGSLVEAGMILERPDLVAAARAGARTVVGRHWLPAPDGGPGGVLRRVSLGDRLGDAEGALSDYALLADGLLVLFSATGELAWYRRAEGLLEVVLTRFTDGDRFFDTADEDGASRAAGGDAPNGTAANGTAAGGAPADGGTQDAPGAGPLFLRPSDPADNASPAGASAAAGALLRFASLSGSHRHRAAAELALRPYTPLVATAPRFAGWGLAVAEALADGPREVAVVAGPGQEELVRTFWRTPTAGAVLAVGVGETGGALPLLAGRSPVDGRAAAYVCRGFVCDRPVTEPARLRDLLGQARPPSRTHEGPGSYKPGPS